ncbi:MAG: Ig-like domain-containing protein [bacterium]|nr:Ig-like domain-containing protein [bacterium]
MMFNNMKSSWFKIPVLFLLLLTLAISSVPRPAKAAVVPVIDVVDSVITVINLIKETFLQLTMVGLQTSMVSELAILNTMQASQHLKEIGIPPWMPFATSFIPDDNLDAFGWIITKLAMATLMQQIVDWVRKGNIDGGPLFVTDWERFLLNAKDKATSVFMQDLSIAQTTMCQPFAAPVSKALSNNIFGRGPTFNQRASCTMGNMQGFLDNAQNGGWDAWHQLTQETNNNPYIVTLMGIEQLSNTQASGVNKNLQEAMASLGLLGTKTCEPATIETEVGDVPLGGNCTITTPGKAVETELSKVLQSNLENLNLADELDEALAAILQSILQNLVFSLGGVLEGDVSGDTTPPPAPTPQSLPSCGDNICASPETTQSCPADCNDQNSDNGDTTPPVIQDLQVSNNGKNLNVVAYDGQNTIVGRNMVTVTFYANGSPIGAGTLSQGRWRLNNFAASLDNGTYAITAVATDFYGNEATTGPITVTVSGSTEPPPVIEPPPVVDPPPPVVDPPPPPA